MVSRKTRTNRTKPRQRQKTRIKQRTRKRSKTKTKTKTKKRVTIVDPTFSKEAHKGTMASSHCVLCESSYHYQSYSTFTDYIEILRDRKLLPGTYVPTPFSKMTLELSYPRHTIEPLYMGKDAFFRQVKKGLRNPQISLIPIVLNLELEVDDNHANCIVINKGTQEIELFEPHGHRSSVSTLGGNPRAYERKIRILKKFWKEGIPSYTVVNVVDVVKETAFQVKYDPQRSTGYCVTWSLLYMNYRLLNPTVPYRALIKHVNTKITTRMLLRYARQVETTLKST